MDSAIIIFQGYQNKILKLVSQQYRAWSDCKDVQTSLAQYTGGKGQSLSVLAGKGLSNENNVYPLFSKPFNIKFVHSNNTLCVIVI